MALSASDAVSAEIIHRVAVTTQYYSRLAPQEAMQHPEEIESVDAPDKRQE